MIQGGHRGLFGSFGVSRIFSLRNACPLSIRKLSTVAHVGISTKERSLSLGLPGRSMYVENLPF